MHLALRSIAAAVGMVLALASCAQLSGERGAVGSSRPAIVIVRSFDAPPDIVALDPTFGYSLHRGAPAVPRRRRAATVGRAAAFHLAEAVTRATQRLGFAAVRSNRAVPDPTKPALIVRGAFLKIDEGRRRHPQTGPSRVIADAQVEYQAPGAAPRQILAVHLDSAWGAPPAEADDDADATRIGERLAQAIATLAEREHWLAAGS